MATGFTGNSRQWRWADSIALLAVCTVAASAGATEVSLVGLYSGKALVVVALIRAHRIGFLVDAAIYGFAVGAGFAILENVWYQVLVPDAGLGLWIARGFGTAIMHGGTTAILAVTGLALLERGERSDAAALLPGYALAVVLHAGYNQLVASPRAATSSSTPAARSPSRTSRRSPRASRRCSRSRRRSTSRTAGSCRCGRAPRRSTFAP